MELARCEKMKETVIIIFIESGSAGQSSSVQINITAQSSCTVQNSSVATEQKRLGNFPVWIFYYVSLRLQQSVKMFCVQKYYITLVCLKIRLVSALYGKTAKLFHGDTKSLWDKIHQP